MKKQFITRCIFLVMLLICAIIAGMTTGARYFINVTGQGTVSLAPSILHYSISPTNSQTFNVCTGESDTISYTLTNTESGEVNSKQARVYVSLVDDSGDVVSTPVSITSVTDDNSNTYSYVPGKGYGPIDLSYNGTTEDEILCRKSF